VELEENIDAFDALDTQIISIAQLERDPAQLPRITEFVHNTFPVVADPDQITRKEFQIFGVYLIDKRGIVRTFIPGTKEARPRLDMIVEELAKMTGKPVPILRAAPVSEPLTAPPTAATLDDPEDAIGVRWMWSHNAVRPRDTFKLAWVTTPAPGYHLYGSVENRMTPFSLTLDLPEGIRLKEPIRYPRSRAYTDPVLKSELFVYDSDIPMPVIYLEADENVVPGEYMVTATVDFQACSDSICLPPSRKQVDLPLTIVGKKGRRGTVAGYEDW
jgi:Thiol:disulfide interchange protein DsbD, N-terminal